MKTSEFFRRTIKELIIHEDTGTNTVEVCMTLLNKISEIEMLENEIGQERIEAFHAGYKSNKVKEENPALECQHRRTQQIKTHQLPFNEIRCLDCGKNL